GSYYLLQEGYDPDFEQLRPGLTLRGMLMRDLIARGIRRYDFLAGRQSYKTEWGGEVTQAACVRFTRSAAARRISYSLPAWNAKPRRTVRRVLPEPVLAMRRRLVSPGGRPAAGQSSSRKLRILAQVYRPLSSASRRITERYALQGGHWRRRSESCCQILTFHR